MPSIKLLLLLKYHVAMSSG